MRFRPPDAVTVVLCTKGKSPTEKTPLPSFMKAGSEANSESEAFDVPYEIRDEALFRVQLLVGGCFREDRNEWQSTRQRRADI